MVIRLVEIVNLKKRNGGHTVFRLCGRQFFYESAAQLEPQTRYI